MAFDQSTRNRLARFVGDSRALLTEEFTRQLQHEYGLDPASGEVTALERLGHLDDARRETAQILRDTLAHYLAGKPKLTAKLRKDTLERIVREQAFTVLNRLCALRMMEGRGLLLESVARGYESRGFQLYSRLAGTALGETGDAYRSYLFSLFDEFAVDLPVLFDRFSPQGRLFPRTTTLLQLLDEINHPDIDPLWAEDETIGWIYQYFNSVEERRQMRAESSAPRNSRELAVRNQFFTPRYVVEFLTDNTLGRIWYEMTQGETALVESCRYLVHRPHEIFLANGEAAPEQPENEADLTQEELLQQPVYIPYRPLKDPRDIKMLDPACGSMHFGLYAFDLYEQIYVEAWHLESSRGAHAFTRPEELEALHKAYANEAAFRRDVPRLIIEHNIHGIDIDPRAVQIAGLSLWLRAQKSWQRQGVRPQDRPTVTRSNVVTAEPMPGDSILLKEFIEQHLTTTPEERLLGQLVQRVFKMMELAGEAGSLLKIEEEISADIAEAKEKWLAKPQPKQVSLFEIENSGYFESEPTLNVSDITEESFWEQIEIRIYDALEQYSKQAENGNGYRRRLFAEDAVRGFAFIDICSRRYDVVLMNPPFGIISAPSKDYLYKTLPEASRDIFAAFITRFVERLNLLGRIGAITNRMAFYNEYLSSWRENIFMGGVSSLDLTADLGYGVLDAVVETAAYVCIRSENRYASFLNALKEEDKQASIIRILRNLHNGSVDEQFVERKINVFSKLPGNRFSYTISPNWIENLNIEEGHNLFSGKGGITTGDDFRFYRGFWEINSKELLLAPYWRWVAKGGNFSRYRANTHLVINWRNKPFLMRIKNSHLYGKPGATYTYRTTSYLSARVLNKGTCFSQGGPGIIVHDEVHAAFVLAYINSFVATYCLEELVGGGDSAGRSGAARNLESRYLEFLPKVKLSDDDIAWFNHQLTLLLNLLRDSDDDEVHPYFYGYLIDAQESLRGNKIQQNKLVFAELAKAYDIIDSFEKRIIGLLHLKKTDVLETYAQSGWPFPTGNDLTSISSDLLNKLDAVPRDEPRLSYSEDTTVYRFQTRLSHYLHADVESLAHRFRIHPKIICEAAGKSSVCDDTGLKHFTKNVVSYCLGIAFGRWDVRYSTGEKELSPLLNSFEPLPGCPPGMLQNAESLPATSNNSAMNYPLRVSWNGILVDDNSQSEDIVGRIREVLRTIWQVGSDSIEAEACALLGVGTLRDYFNNPNGFFDDHVSRYSKSRRYAPIYWPLSTPSTNYTLWIYYHRIDNQLLYTAINDFVDPKLKDVTQQVNALRQKTSRSKTEENDLTRLTDLEAELQEFRAELLRLAAVWKPNLNDGVQITAAPLWRLFQHRQWQNKLKDTWEKLEAGEYDWAHLALSIWPERVVPKCVEDRSLAIAHDLETLFWVEEEGNWRRLQTPDQEIAGQKERRQITAHDRLRRQLQTLAAGAGRGMPGYQVWQYLSEGTWDDTHVALALWPERAGEKCWDNPLLAGKLSLKMPAKRTKTNRKRFLKRILDEGTPELAQAVAAAFQDESEAFDAIWQALVNGKRDEQPLALALWPERVVDKCVANVEMALKHDLHPYFWYQPPGGSWRRRKPQAQEINEEISRRQNNTGR